MRDLAHGRTRGALCALLTALAALVAAAPAAAAPFPWDYDVTPSLLSLPVNSAPAPYVVDWNEDDRDDLVTGLWNADTHRGIAVHLRKEDGTLGEPESVFSSGNAASVTGFARYFRPTVGDWDADGRKDLVFGQMYSNKGVLLCLNGATDEAPAFAGEGCKRLRTSSGALVGAADGGTTAFLSPELVDWDEDGDLDLLVGTGRDAAFKGVRLYRNDGTASEPVLADPVVVAARGVTTGLAYENEFEPDVVDLNDDGRKDLVIGGAQYQPPSTQQFVLRQCLNTGTDSHPLFTTCSSRILPGFVNNAIDFADWDDDGSLDLLRGFFSGFIANPVTYFHGRSPDSDGDGVSDSLDNCKAVPNWADLKLDRDNPIQIDTDNDRKGDACDEDDDGDVALDEADLCTVTADPEQADRDEDGRGDACDPKDDRPGQPGKGSYEWQQANKVGWGRKKVIMMRADALSLSYRRTIAEALTQDALDRGLPFTLAVIPWDRRRFAPSLSAGFLRQVATNPLLEVAQHGTYHTCMYTRGRGEESDCGMDLNRSFNLMRVGLDALRGAFDESTASHRMTGFIPPADASDAAAEDAARALGYRYFASAYYAEHPRFIYTDDSGMVHVPWSQIACGNGAASWTNCATTSKTAHSGVDCADETICKPTREPNPKDYTFWEGFAQNSLKERCRYDLDERYGVCAVLFELTSYDEDFSKGQLDERAREGYRRALDDLKDLAEETGAVFMTLGDYAAAQQITDKQAPEIAITSPEDRAYGHAERFTVGFQATDDLSGVHELRATLDGEAIRDGDAVDVLRLGVGEHTLKVVAEDTAGNTSEKTVTFEVVATIESLQALVSRFDDEGAIGNDGVVSSLERKLAQAKAARDAGRSTTAANVLGAFINEVRAQSGRHVDADAAEVLIADAVLARDAL